jgi:hypothetical protein
MLSDRSQSACHEDQTGLRRRGSDQKRRKSFGEELRARHVDIPGIVPSLSFAQSSGGHRGIEVNAWWMVSVGLDK